MTKQKPVKIALAIVLPALAGVIAWQLLQEHEPVYQGEPLSFWLNKYGDGNYVGIGAQLAKSEADEAVRQIGTNAIPLLLQRLQTQDSAFSEWLMHLAQKHSPIRIHLHTAWNRRIQALEGLTAIAPKDSVVAVPLLKELVNSPDVATSVKIFVQAALRRITSRQSVPTAGVD